MSAAELRRLIGVVEAKLAALPKIDWSEHGSHERHRAAVAAALDALAREKGARSKADYAGTRISLGGVKASSTIGGAMAMQNWCVGARKRLHRLTEVVEVGNDR